MLQAIIGAMAVPVAVLRVGDRDGHRGSAVVVAVNPPLAALLGPGGVVPPGVLAGDAAPVRLGPGAALHRPVLHPLAEPDGGSGLTLATFVPVPEPSLAAEVAPILDLQSEMVSRWRPDGTIDFCNQAFARQCGRPRAEIVGASLFDLTPPGEIAQILANLARLTPEAPAAGYDHHLVGPDGAERWQEWIDRGCFGSGGRLVAVLSVGRDITARKLAERRLAESEQLLKLALEAGHQEVWEAAVRDAQGTLEVRCGGHGRSGLDGALQRYHPQDRQRLAGAIASLLRGEAETVRLEVRRRTEAAGAEAEEERKGWAWLQVTGRVAERDGAGRPVRLVGTMADIQRRKEAEEHLRESEQRLRLALEAGSFGVWESDVATGTVRFDPGLVARRGWQVGRGELALAEVRTLIHPRDRVRVRAAYNALRRGERPQVRLEYRVRRGDGAYVWLEEHAVAAERDPAGRALRLVGVATDISARKDAELRLAHLALHDPLTGLPNRRALAEALDRALARSRRSGLGLAVLALDLDGFKAINDRHGHPVGDAALVQVAERLRRTVRRGDALARFGGDEFAVVAGDLKGPNPVVRLARRLRAVLAEPLVLPGAIARVGVSVGVAFHPGDGDGPEALLSSADRALYAAKREGVGLRLCGELPAAA